MSESSGPGPSPTPSPSLTAVGPEGSSSALPDLGELRRLAEAARDMKRAPGCEREHLSVHYSALLVLFDRLDSMLGRLRILEQAETQRVAELRATNQRLNRRCQQAEAAAARSADSVKAELYGRRPGKPLGRMLANIRLTELEAAADALAEHVRDFVPVVKLLLARDHFHEQTVVPLVLSASAALAAYRAVRSKETP